MRRKKDGIAGDFAHFAIKNGDLEKQAREIKKIIIPRGRRGFNNFSPVSKKDKKPGPVKNFTQLEIDVENIKQKLKNMKFIRRGMLSFTDMTLAIINAWPSLSKKLENKGIVKRFHYSSEGKIYFTVPLMIAGMREFYPDIIEKLIDKKIHYITNEELRDNASSIFTQVAKIIKLLGFMPKERVKIIRGRSYAYEFDEKIYKYSFDELYFLHQEGLKLARKSKENKRKKTKNISLKEMEKIKTFNIKGNGKANEINIRIFPDGSINVKISY